MESRPEIRPDLFWVWDSFSILSRQRLSGPNGPSPIQISEILSYCELKSLLEPLDRELLLFYLSELDSVWIEKTYEKIESQYNKAKIKAKK